MNLNVSLNAGVYDNFDLGDTRAGAPLDPIPTFMTMRLDRALISSGGRGRGAAASPTAVASRRALGPAVFSTTWAYIDQVLVPPGASTAELAATSAARTGSAASAVNTTRLVVKKLFAINRMDSLLIRWPDGNARKCPSPPVMRRSDRATGSIEVSM